MSDLHSEKHLEGGQLVFLPHDQSYCTADAQQPRRHSENIRYHDDTTFIAGENKRAEIREEIVYEGWSPSEVRFVDRWLRPRRATLTMLLPLIALCLLLLHGCVLCIAKKPPVIKGNTQFFPPTIQQSWAAYTPYFPVKQYSPPPAHCKITQVNIIQRHGARFPTSGATTRILTAVNNLKSATDFLDPRLDFLRNYTYTLGKDNLIPFGALQSVDAGQGAFQRYSQLVSSKNLPFVRASGSTRVVDSATNWTSGFSLASHKAFNPVLSVILDESLNDTLDDSMCPNAGSSDPQTNIWTSIYGAPIAARLNAQAPGATVTAADISNLIPLCAFETLAKEIPSPFCSLFTEDEFAQFEYFGDLDKFYNTGYGQALGRVQGVGYVNELIARLTESPVRDNTQTNHTLDASPVTFPLNRTIYADFSHDNQMIAIYAALGLFNQTVPLDPTAPDPARTWIASHLTPFSARMVTERLSCGSTGPAAGHGQGKIKPQTFVRILVNDALQPLPFCGGDRNGLCTLDAFVESQSYARNDGEGDFEKCFS
ncbi:3-phytase B [Psilocybe cubensis]|uniref:3-phytase B n=2 Tax=Psilocybe cubensis TaxID=181762 RepID=A0ACB8H3C6_PSICU|nr:3-phytase B [Psilocybe cubensis]KAH9482157.1 3-phytase B [Psilocybe cubensis]